MAVVDRCGISAHAANIPTRRTCNSRRVSEILRDAGHGGRLFVACSRITNAAPLRPDATGGDVFTGCAVDGDDSRRQTVTDFRDTRLSITATPRRHWARSIRLTVVSGVFIFRLLGPSSDASATPTSSCLPQYAWPGSIFIGAHRARCTLTFVAESDQCCVRRLRRPRGSSTFVG